MNLLAFPRTIKDILTLNRKYSIPRFQREYAWEEEELKIFWEDILNRISIVKTDPVISDYFIGSLVLVGDEQKDTIFSIVDGQQRLTTITIIFSALTHAFFKIEEEGLAQSCYSYVEGKDGDYNPFFKLENENPKPFFQHRIQNKVSNESYTPVTEEEKKLLCAYNFFKERLVKDKLEKIFGTKIEYKEILKAIRDQILSFKTIYITVESIEEAYTIFETLNAKGKDLETIDLIKNKVFKVLDGEHPTDEAKEKWKKVKSTLNERSYSENISKFFRHYWISKYEFTTDSKIYSSFLKKIPEKSIDYERFINDLENEVVNYLMIISPQSEDWRQQEEKKVYNSLIALNLFRVEQVRTFILALMEVKAKKLINTNEFSDNIKLIEKFHFIFTAVCSSRASGLEGKYSTLARRLRNTQNKVEARSVLKELKEYYQEKKPNYDTFESKFKEIEFTSKKTNDKKLIQYILGEIEKEYYSTDEIIPYSFSLEHIASQSSNLNGFEKIGNLLPLCRKINNNMGNISFIEKKRHLKNSELKIVNNFLEENQSKEEWGTNDIEERTKNIASLSYNYVWNF